MITRRFFHISKMNFATVQGSSLSKLRKSTGYTMSNCKKALELHPNDITKAEEWLHAEAKKLGWSKIANLQSRAAAQGLVGVYTKGSIGAMVEVNCETDFVARNSEFQMLVTKVLSSCANHAMEQNLEGDCKKMILDESYLNSMKLESSSLGDLIASAVGKFGEKTLIRRAVCFKASEQVQLCSYSHPKIQCSNLMNGTLGKYGGLLAYCQKDTLVPRMDSKTLQELGHQLCQHIVGMDPQSLGEFSKENAPAFLPNQQQAFIADFAMKKLQNDVETEKPVFNEEQSSDQVNDSEEECENVENLDSNETRLLYQPFLLDPECRVGEFLARYSLEVLDFQRFECGENEDN